MILRCLPFSNCRKPVTQHNPPKSQPSSALASITPREQLHQIIENVVKLGECASDLKDRLLYVKKDTDPPNTLSLPRTIQDIARLPSKTQMDLIKALVLDNRLSIEEVEMVKKDAAFLNEIKNATFSQTDIPEDSLNTVAFLDDKSFLYDKNFLHDLIKTGNTYAIRYLRQPGAETVDEASDKTLSGDKNTILENAKKNKSCITLANLKYCALAKDKEFILKVLNQDYSGNIDDIHESLRHDPEIMAKFSKNTNEPAAPFHLDYGCGTEVHQMLQTNQFGTI